ncbi:hypothetical protein N657DRAFT_44705 [Parathielavia appendiculata]|uniref:Uncharacterized protein n=1 Tax=Parathielavia appendiculata TaxID=2587402 RepID=A0AAN6U9T2_9PEZI|nr:hypothetical protein N657DRAFT_44705 [Parathielavia appendiculata]
MSFESSGARPSGETSYPAFRNPDADPMRPSLAACSGLGPATDVDGVAPSGPVDGRVLFPNDSRNNRNNGSSWLRKIPKQKSEQEGGKSTLTNEVYPYIYSIYGVRVQTRSSYPECVERPFAAEPKIETRYGLPEAGSMTCRPPPPFSLPGVLQMHIYAAPEARSPLGDGRSNHESSWRKLFLVE